MSDMQQQRRPIVAGNWKMNTTLGEGRDLAGALKGPLAALQGVDAVICPPFTSVAAVGEALGGSSVFLGAQNCFYEVRGAYTGEVSPAMLADVGCRYVILGHSERRAHLGETDAVVHRKVQAALDHGLTPILCVGESLAQKDAGHTEQVVEGQVRAALAGLTEEQGAGMIVAYEPIWAIGTGRAATAAQANATIGFIRRTIATVLGREPASAVRLQYGGSVTPANAAELFAQPQIDGALVGGASLNATDFIAICTAAERAVDQHPIV